MKTQNLEDYFNEIETPKPKSKKRKSDRYIPKSRRIVTGKYYETTSKEKIRAFKKMSQELKNEQTLIFEKCNSDATLYEIGVLNGIEKIIKLMNTHL